MTRSDAGEGAERRPSSRSLRGLDSLNFAMADVAGGVGPYLSAFLAGSEHWQPGSIGMAMATGSVAAAIFQLPAGLLVDALRVKRLLVAGSGLVIAAGCLLIARIPSFQAVLLAQVLIGLASAIIPPAIGAMTLGLVGRDRFDARVSRNQVFNHGGNFVSACLAGGLAHFLSYDWIFYLVCAFAVASAAAVALIRPAEIDHVLARGGESEVDAAGRVEPIALRAVFKRRSLLIFLASVVLFHSANAAMLPMAGQMLALTHPGTDAIALSACIVSAQFVMLGVAFAVGRALDRGIGRKAVFLVAFALLPLRGVLFSLSSDPFAVVAIQLLDGVAAGIFGVVSVIIAADVMRGTGRFNLAQALVALAVGIGAGLSNVMSGYIVEFAGFPVGFLALAGIALAALAFFALFMPETREAFAAPSEVVPCAPDAR